jgi:hypothetical protein
MGIALFFAAASNLSGELKVDRVVAGTRTCVRAQPGNLIFKQCINATPKIALPKRAPTPASSCSVRWRTVRDIDRDGKGSLSTGQSLCAIS